MRILLMFLILILNGCAYNEIYIFAGGDVYCTSEVEKPFKLIPSVTAKDNTVPLK